MQVQIKSRVEAFMTFIAGFMFLGAIGLNVYFRYDPTRSRPNPDLGIIQPMYEHGYIFYLTTREYLAFHILFIGAPILFIAAYVVASFRKKLN